MTTDSKKYNVDNYIEDALVSKHESKPDRMIRIELEDGTVVIGKNRYDALKKIPTKSLLKSQKSQIEIFEKHHGISDYIKKITSQKEESEKILKAQEEKRAQIIATINKQSVWNVFLKTYEKHYQTRFIQDDDTLANIAPLVLYFAKDEQFLKHGAKDVNGAFLSKPNFDKGLCIIGGFGNGKTTIMNTFQRMFIGLDGFAFGRFSSHEIVRKYEEASKHSHPEIIENFWNMLIRSELYIDDVKAENEALAYGKKNLLNSLFQERYNKKLKTHISMNYAQGSNGNVLDALLEFKGKYSNQVYDRIYEMYNIIEFKGKSFRK